MILAAMMYLALTQPSAKDVVVPPARETADDPATLRRRLEESMRAVEEKLRRQDAGQPTQDLQKSILNDLDQLLKRLQNPPPKDKNQQPPPQDQPPGDSPDNGDKPAPNSGSGPPGGKSSPQSSPPSRSQQGGGRRERKGHQPPSSDMAREGEQSPASRNTPPTSNQPNDKGPKPGDTEGNPGGNPDKGGGATMPSQATGKPDKMSDVYRDVWGHLPESLRQEVDHYYRDRFMPKYQELLRQYYTKLAEADRKNEPKK